MSHTEGKLHTGGVFNPTSAGPTVNLWSETPADCQSGEIVAFGVNPDNARRLVACWNAMDGVDDPELWVAQMKHMDADHTISRDIIQELQKERDKLVKVLRDLWESGSTENVEAILARYQEGKS